MARITVVTGGHLSTCPRMVKAADAFHAAGHSVRMISTVHTEWAAEADGAYATRPWMWHPIDYRRDAARWRWLITGARARMAVALARGLDARTPALVVTRALGRVHDELVAAILRHPADLVYGGTRGALAAVIDATAIAGVPCGVDFEDFHCGEDDPVGDGVVRNRLSAIVMQRAANEAAFVTAGSAAIADACARQFGARPIAINNVFRLPAPPSFDHRPGPLRLYWFSQTTGPGRGLEDIVDATGRAGVDCALHLRGVISETYAGALRTRAARVAPRLELTTCPPAAPDRMIEHCRGFDAGISAEQGPALNRLLSLPNKALTYPLAGLALVLTTTDGHRPLADDLAADAVSYAPGDVDALAAGLVRWSSPAVLRSARQASWEAARRRWHWDHPLERETLVGAAEAAL
jgi:hypothetical protein